MISDERMRRELESMLLYVAGFVVCQNLVYLTKFDDIVCGNVIGIMILVSFQQTLHFEESRIIFQLAILGTQQTHFNHFTQN